MNIILTLAMAELQAYLRNWGAVFWTFAYPVALLILLSMVFGTPGQQHVRVEVLNGANSSHAQDFVTALTDKVDMIDGFNIDVVWVEGLADYSPQRGAVQLGFSEGFSEGIATGSTTSTIQLSVVGEINPQNGGMLSIIAETTEVFNRYLTGSAQLVAVDYSQLPAERQNNGNYNTFLVSGLTALTVVSTAMFGFAMVLVEMRQNGALKMFQVFPMSKAQFLTGFILSRAGILAVFCILFFVLSNLVLQTGLEFNALSTVFFLLLLILGIVAFLSVGLLLVSVIKKGATATAIINIVNLPILFLSDLFIPVALMPAYIKVVAEQSPVYLFVNSLREVTQPGFDVSSIGLTLLSLALVSAVCMLISSRLFQWRTL